MLKSEALDRQSFEDILKNALHQIAKRYPEWTNFNPSDPGMTIVELLAWLTEIQQYHLNVIGKDHRLRYLKLLGTVPQKEAPAVTFLKITAVNREIPQGTVYMADDIPFETAYAFTAADNEISAVESDSQQIVNYRNMLDSMQFSPFGEKETVFRIYLRQQPRVGDLLSFYMEQKPIPNCGKITENFPGFVRLKGDTCTEIISDETCGFSRNGTICIKIWERIPPERGRYPIQLSIAEGEYPIPPVLTRMALNVVPGIQRQTLPLYQKAMTERYIGMATGVCNFCIPCAWEGILPDSLVIGVQEEDGFYLWKRVDDFDASEKTARHFVFEDGMLKFGNGERGMPPEGQIYLAGCEISRNAAGNIKTGTVDSLDETTESRGINITPSTGGRAAETIDECCDRVRKTLVQSERCVTLADFEQAVRNTPGVPVYRVKAFLNERVDNCIIIAVENIPGRDGLNSCYLKHMKQHILSRVMVGTKVEFTAPEYIGIYVYGEILGNPSGGLLKQTETWIESFFHQINFGETISIHALNQHICKADWVNGVKSLDVSFSGIGARRLENGDIQLKNSSLPKLEKASFVRISSR